ncbi:hypothetical protein BHM03_00027857 [Ensete ventricosum]|nr:hypothetical protein BHM03_00027857 [Ensete ventricosum]
MVSAWRADDSNRGCGSGGETLEMKRRHRVQLEGNNDGGKDRKEEGWIWQGRAKEEGGLERVTTAGATAGECVVGSDGRQLGWSSREEVGEEEGNYCSH